MQDKTIDIVTDYFPPKKYSFTETKEHFVAFFGEMEAAGGTEERAIDALLCKIHMAGDFPRTLLKVGKIERHLYPKEIEDDAVLHAVFPKFREYEGLTRELLTAAIRDLLKEKLKGAGLPENAAHYEQWTERVSVDGVYSFGRVKLKQKSFPKNKQGAFSWDKIIEEARTHVAAQEEADKARKDSDSLYESLNAILEKEGFSGSREVGIEHNRLKISLSLYPKNIEDLRSMVASLRGVGFEVN